MADPIPRKALDRNYFDRDRPDPGPHDEADCPFNVDENCPHCGPQWQERAQVFGWELNQFEDGQLVIVADEDRNTFTGPSRNLKAHNHVARTATGRLTDGYHKLCWKARELVGLSALSQQGEER